MSDKKHHYIYVQHCYHAVVKRCPAGTLEKFGDHPVAVIRSFKEYDLAVSREGLKGPWWYADNVARGFYNTKAWKEAITHCLRPDVEEVPFESVKLDSDEFWGLKQASYFGKKSLVRAIGGDVCGEWRFRHEPLPEAQYIAAAHSFMEPLVKQGLVQLRTDKEGREHYGLTDKGREELKKDGLR